MMRRFTSACWMIWEQGAIDMVPSNSSRKLPKDFDADIYKERNKIERSFGRLKASFRRIATRKENTSRNFMAMIKLASVRLRIESYEPTAQCLTICSTKKRVLTKNHLAAILSKAATKVANFATMFPCT